jgi:hypothetical protein
MLYNIKQGIIIVNRIRILSEGICKNILFDMKGKIIVKSFNKSYFYHNGVFR